MMRSPGSARRALIAALLTPLVLFTACGEPEPQPVHVGAEECAHCRMLISERRWAAQLLTTRGRAINFDSIECLAAWVRTAGTDAADVHSLWVTDALEGDGWVNVDDAAFLRSPSLRTPMGGGLAAYSSAARAREQQAQLGGAVLSWPEVVSTATPAADGGEHHHGA
jgi:copper chaperone NosL